MLTLAAIVFAAYLIGGIPFGYLIARGRGVDIFKAGSGNIGATNVGRVLGFRFGILVFALDFAKGALPVYAALLLEPRVAADLHAGLLPVAAGLAAFLGHLLPIYLGFRGGKGVATGAGVVMVLMPVPTLFALIAWVTVAASTRYISLASILAALVLCLTQLGATSADVENPRNAFCVLAAVLVAIKHRSNVVRLWNGTENRLPPSTVLTQVSRIVHVLAVGLWFGSSVFFTFAVALPTFGEFERLAKLPAEERPGWLPLPADYSRADALVKGPLEQGRRLAGTVVVPIFPAYFLTEAACGLFALVPALAWLRAHRQERVHRIRVMLLLAGLAFVAANLLIEPKIQSVRAERNQAVDAHLQSLARDTASATPSQDLAGLIRSFQRWHLASVFLNLAAIVMVSGAMCLTASLPGASSETEAPPRAEPPTIG